MCALSAILSLSIQAQNSPGVMQAELVGDYPFSYDFGDRSGRTGPFDSEGLEIRNSSFFSCGDAGQCPMAIEFASIPALESFTIMLDAKIFNAPNEAQYPGSMPIFTLDNGCELLSVNVNANRQLVLKGNLPNQQVVGTGRKMVDFQFHKLVLVHQNRTTRLYMDDEVVCELKIDLSDISACMGTRYMSFTNMSFERGTTFAGSYANLKVFMGVPSIYRNQLPDRAKTTKTKKEYELLAYYPLATNGEDLTGANGELMVEDEWFKDDALQSCGEYTKCEVVATLDELDLNVFTISIEFNMPSFPTDELYEFNGVPIYSIDSYFRFLQVSLMRDNSLQLKANNKEIVIPLRGMYKLNTWHKIVLTYKHEEVRVYLDANLIGAQPVSLGEKMKERGYGTTFCNTNYGNGATFFGAWRNLKVYNGLLPIAHIVSENQLLEEEVKIKERGGPLSSITTDQAAPITKEGMYYALLVATEEYDDETIDDLENPVNDAKKLAAVLETNYVFDDVNLVANPTRAELFAILEKYSKKVKPTDNLLIFYAGHGRWDPKFEKGYWMLKDAQNTNRGTWFSNNDMHDYVKGIDTKHTLLIADACFGGAIFKSRGVVTHAEIDIKTMYNLPSRQAMTSGALNEVPDKSIFMKYLIHRLETNKDLFIDSETLFNSFKKAVILNSPNPAKPNVPQFGDIHNTGGEGGDFIFIKK